jgi:hypothetical protein
MDVLMKVIDYLSVLGSFRKGRKVVLELSERAGKWLWGRQLRAITNA